MMVVERKPRTQMWDAIITMGNIAFIPALLPTIFSKQAHVPRLTSGTCVIGVLIVVLGLLGAGLVLSPVVVAGVGVMWGFIFVFRGGTSLD
jgi:hypothetical protein